MVPLVLLALAASGGALGTARAAAGAHGSRAPAPRTRGGGAVVFTDSRTGELLRLALPLPGVPDGAPRQAAALPADGLVPIAADLEPFGGLLLWERGGAAGPLLLVAGVDHTVAAVDPWCAGAGGDPRLPLAPEPCPATLLVDVPQALGPRFNDHAPFHLGGMAWCHGALYIMYAGNNSTRGANGVLRCAGCVVGQDCTRNCAPVLDGAAPGPGMQQLGGYAAGIACAASGADGAEGAVLVVDNTNFRVQAIPSACTRAPCNVTTYARRLDFPLGIAVLPPLGGGGGGDEARVLLSLDATIGVLTRGGQRQQLWAREDNTGYLAQAPGSRVLAAVGDIVSFDAACQHDCVAGRRLVWNATAGGGGHIAYGALAYVPEPGVPLG